MPDELTTYLFRRGTAAQWREENQVLLPAQLGLETDTRRWKAGDEAGPRGPAWNPAASARPLSSRSTASWLPTTLEATAGISANAARRSGS